MNIRRFVVKVQQRGGSGSIYQDDHGEWCLWKDVVKAFPDIERTNTNAIYPEGTTGKPRRIGSALSGKDQYNRAVELRDHEASTQLSRRTNDTLPILDDSDWDFGNGEAGNVQEGGK